MACLPCTAWILKPALRRIGISHKRLIKALGYALTSRDKGIWTFELLIIARLEAFFELVISSEFAQLSLHASKVQSHHRIITDLTFYPLQRSVLRTLHITHDNQAPPAMALPTLYLRFLSCSEDLEPSSGWLVSFAAFLATPTHFWKRCRL